MSEWKINQYADIYQSLKRALKWKVFDNLVVMTAASMYVMNNQELRVDKFLHLADEIKNRAGIFSAMRSHPRFTMAAMLDVTMEDPEAAIPELFTVYQSLKDKKFKSGASTYMAAFTILRNGGAVEETAEQTMNLFQNMKKEHPFLTDANDYPLAVLLAIVEENNMIERIETCYDELKREGFKTGNHLQFLSHILSLGSRENPRQSAQRAARVLDTWKNAGLKSKPLYYPVIGMLTLLPDELLDMEAIQNTAERLNRMKHFKWSKEMNVLVAGSFFISEKMEDGGLAETSLYTSMEAILQAQQTAMIAAVTAGAAASASAGSGGN